MISNRLRKIFLISIPVFIAHGLEEYFTGFYGIDNFFKPIVGFSAGAVSAETTFLLFQIIWWLFLIAISLFTLNRRWVLYLMFILGLIFIFETHHLIKAVLNFSYYSGAATALLFPIIGFFFWKELIKEFVAKEEIS